MIARRITLNFHYLLAHYRGGIFCDFLHGFAIARQQPGPASALQGQSRAAESVGLISQVSSQAKDLVQVRPGSRGRMGLNAVPERRQEASNMLCCNSLSPQLVSEQADQRLHGIRAGQDMEI